MTPPLELPNGARFAFTILDDTDDATVANVKPVYDLLHELGLRTTKTVWPVDCPEGSRLFFAAETLADPAYLEFVKELVARNFELAGHGATMEPSERVRTTQAFEVMKSEFGHIPEVYCNHGQNLENIYWGERRYTNIAFRGLLKTVRLITGGPRFRGEDTLSPFFWGDLCFTHYKFVRNFTFPRLDVSTIDKHMPYKRTDTPYVRYWFSTSDAPDATAFEALLSNEAIDELISIGGVCIVSTHLGKGFTSDGVVRPRVETALRRIAGAGGWFVPVSEILEHLLSVRGGRVAPQMSLSLLEARHLIDLVRRRFT